MAGRRLTSILVVLILSGCMTAGERLEMKKEQAVRAFEEAVIAREAARTARYEIRRNVPRGT